MVRGLRHSAPAKIDRIRSYGAMLAIGGDAAAFGAQRMHALDQDGTLLCQGTVGFEFEVMRRVSTHSSLQLVSGLIGGLAAP